MQLTTSVLLSSFAHTSQCYDSSINPLRVQITNSPFVFPYISYKSSEEKLLKYQ